MKTFMIIVTVLSIMAIIYAKKPVNLETFSSNFRKCFKEKNGTFKNRVAEAIVCAENKDGNVLNANGEFIRENALKQLENNISDPNKLQTMKAIYNKCHDKADRSRVTGHEQAIKIVNCLFPVFTFFYKL
ncbi:uncharacterized protein LOC116853091 [Odontomachus brunneus]|uniref:uncharacterized protein LOC116853091 n=1 Tax=Odontomachus brunneus TaxID=486640 RepID=UPI0013F290F3|nr:uncharacterized protein LOC116853091 [Odontomachus brunneus]